MLMALILSATMAYADDIDDFLSGPPFQGGLPRCLELLTISDSAHDACVVELEAFEGQVTECQGVIDDLTETIAGLQDALSECEAQVTGLPGDGLTGTALSFSDTGNTILDNVTGLEWAKKNLTAGSPLHRDLIVTYAQAEAHIADLNASEYEGGGWRLPNLKELLSIMNYNGPQPIVPDIFGPTVLQPFINYFWTTTPHVQDANQRWLFDGNIGFVTPAPKTNSHRFMAVR
jgi:hypothetical protein